jgi:endoglucanase
MNFLNKHIFVVVLSLLIANMSIRVTAQKNSENTPIHINGKLQVLNKKLCNQFGKPIQLRGVSTHGLQWFYENCYEENKLIAFDTLKNWGTDVLRVSMYVQEDGYEKDPAGFTQKVLSLVKVATERGMYAIVDFHILDPGDPNENTENAKTFFAAISSACKNHTNVIYEICNEPNGEKLTWQDIKKYADQVIPVIKANQPDAVVLCGTPAWCTFGFSNGHSLLSEDGFKSILNKPLAFSHVMYTFHFYADSHKDAYLELLDKASDELPVFVSEFGFQTYTGDEANNKEMSDKYIALMHKKKISWCNWNFSDDFRSGAIWKSGTCGSNNWATSNLKEAGTMVRDYIKYPADDFQVK